MPPQRPGAPRLSAKERRQIKQMKRLEKMMRRQGPSFLQKGSSILLSLILVSALVFTGFLVVTLVMRLFE